MFIFMVSGTDPPASLFSHDHSHRPSSPFIETISRRCFRIISLSPNTMERLLRLAQRLSTTTTGTEKRAVHMCKTISNDTINIETSPFFQLPASVRKRIYGYVLGGSQIRVCDTKNCKRLHRCRSKKRKLNCPAYIWKLCSCHFLSTSSMETIGTFISLSTIALPMLR
ncbi:unnamed protein product [Alternaria burnsii]|nr:unnamed protein product [Alternaria burnsii]